MQYIKDKFGVKYRLRKSKECDGFLRWDITLNGIRVGYIVGVIKSNHLLELCELVVEDYSQPSGNSTIESLLFNELSEADKVNYRQKGLGKELLKVFINFAREQGFKRICGSVVQTDIVIAAQQGIDLIQWYKRQGFEEGPPYIGAQIAKTYVYLDVNNPRDSNITLDNCSE